MPARPLTLPAAKLMGIPFPEFGREVYFLKKINDPLINCIRLKELVNTDRFRKRL